MYQKNGSESKYWIAHFLQITWELVNQHVQKVLYTFVVYTVNKYFNEVG